MKVLFQLLPGLHYWLIFYNKDMFRIIILGSGSCIASKNRGYPGALINYNNKWMLFDAGSGTLDKIAALDIDRVRK